MNNLGSFWMEKYTSEIRNVHNLDNVHIVELFTLFEKHYDHVNFENFKEDLNDKDSILIVYENSMIVGFTTIKRYMIEFQSQYIQVIFSGDTIMDHAHWGSPILASTWLKHSGKIKAEHPDCPLYWFLIVKGHRTYRYLPVFSMIFYPSYKSKTPLYEQSLLDHLALKAFGKHYLQEQGIIHNPHRGQLKESLAKIPDYLFQKDDIKFFYQKNANYQNGDELVCLCELSENNLKPFARRIFKQGYDIKQPVNL